MTTGTHPPAGARIQPDYPALPTFGWFLLAAIGQALIIPSPWTLTAAYRFVCRNTRLPDGRRLSFAGQPGDIWYIIVAVALIALLPQIGGRLARIPAAGSFLLQVAVVIANAGLLLMIIRWFVANIKSDDGSLSIRFEGSISSIVGWQLLLILSMVTIIGWAWVAKFYVRWMCRQVAGTMEFDFIGSGLSILWRSVVFVLASMLIVPIPWMLRWFANWYVSQIIVSPPR